MIPYAPPVILAPSGYIKPARFALDPLHPLSRGLVGCWPLGDTVAGLTADISLSGAHAIPTGSPTFAPSHHGGQALKLAAASSQYFNVGNRNEFAFEYTSKFSLCVWVNYGSAVLGSNILSKQQNSGSFIGYGLGTESGSGKIQMFLYNGAVGGIDAVWPSAYADNAWHFLVGTYDGSGSKTGFLTYADGQLVSKTSTLSATLATTVLSSAAFQINGRGGAGNLWGGNMECPRAYANRILTPSEIAWLYAEPYAGLMPRQPRYMVGVTPTFKPYWAVRNNNFVIGTGVQ